MSTAKAESVHTNLELRRDLWLSLHEVAIKRAKRGLKKPPFRALADEALSALVRREASR